MQKESGEIERERESEEIERKEKVERWKEKVGEIERNREWGKRKIERKSEVIGLLYLIIACQPL